MHEMDWGLVQRAMTDKADPMKILIPLSSRSVNIFAIPRNMYFGRVKCGDSARCAVSHWPRRRTVMHEMDLAELSMAFGALQVDARLQYGLSQLILKLDERYVKREEFEEHIHGVRGELVFPHPPSDEIKPKATCECVDDGWITDLMDCWDHAYPKFCCYCGLPLPNEEEKP